MIFDALLTLAYPHVCAICARSVEQRKFGVACEACWRATRIFTAADAICSKCGALNVMRCGRCQLHAFTAARAVGLYEGALRQSVLLLKRQPHLSQYLETLLASAAKRTPVNASTSIIPVPLHLERLKSRGFNQASIMAESLSKSLRLPVNEVSLVRVSGSEKYRAGLDRKGRQDTVAGAFEVRHPRLVEGEDILLCDDVFTTGATVSACAEALFAAGAWTVSVLTLARADR